MEKVWGCYWGSGCGCCRIASGLILDPGFGLAPRLKVGLGPGVGLVLGRDLKLGLELRLGLRIKLGLALATKGGAETDKGDRGWGG